MLVTITFQELIATFFGFALVGMMFAHLWWVGLTQDRTSYWSIALSVVTMFLLVYLWLA